MRAQNFHGKYKLLKMSETVLKFVHQVPLINWVHSKKAVNFSGENTILSLSR